ncbi:MAG TPA: NAD(P)H-dependent oxidoreductase [Paludibacter sp.]|nr:NAD(P)H-dependent oxidoreductase [Paludibacter sp.]
MKIAILVGSLRKESYNLKIANALIKLMSGKLIPEIVPIGQLQLYNQDFEDNLPTEWIDFRKKIKEFDALLFITPEYNRSMPAVLKNAIDVGSRPLANNVWNEKPGAIISVTPGRLGAFGANHHLRQTFMAVNIPTMPQPEVYIGGAKNLFDSNNELVDKSIIELLEKFLAAYESWIAKNIVK